MAVIIGDIYGDVGMAKAFLSFRPEAEHIALGDYIDSRDAAAINFEGDPSSFPYVAVLPGFLLFRYGNLY